MPEKSVDKPSKSAEGLRNLHISWYEIIGKAIWEDFLRQQNNWLLRKTLFRTPKPGLSGR